MPLILDHLHAGQRKYDRRDAKAARLRGPYEERPLTSGERVLIGPVHSWLEHYFESHDYAAVAAEHGFAINERTLRRWVSQEAKRAPLAALDHVLTFLGRPDLVTWLESDK